MRWKEEILREVENKVMDTYDEKSDGGYGGGKGRILVRGGVGEANLT